MLCTFNTLGTPTNTAIHKYMNQKKVPQLFVATGASKWGKPKEFPWTMGFQPDYHTEAVIYAKHILANVKDPKIAVLMQNDDYGKDYWEGFKEGLGKEAGRVVKHVTYEVTDPTVDSQIIQLKDSGANVFFNIAMPKFAAQAMRKAADLGWKPAHIPQQRVGPGRHGDEAGGLRQRAGHHHGGLAQGSDRPAVGRRRRAARHGGSGWPSTIPSGNWPTCNYVYAYSVSFLMERDAEEVRRQPDARQLMKQAASHQKLRVPCLLPGITVSTSPTDYYPVQAVQLAALQGRDLGAVRRHHVTPKAADSGGLQHNHGAEGRRRAAFFFARFRKKLRCQFITGRIAVVR